ncbi:Uncharacterised protein [Starkeya nomas]|uniref:Uncharacterized protein n=1 Tax=Starkeya nomas TaxID=2666134 RepID=A0A5S9P090_9HYPH|nr:hypothetical protein [Starkeya nomas]CAA0096350.1 Uncharacterised protein [Starkeya nomas]
MSRTTAPANAGTMPTERDRLLAESFQDLEHNLSTLRAAAAVLEIVEDQTILRRTEFAETVRQMAGVPLGYEVYVFTEAQAEAIRHATFALRLEVEKICERYFAEMDKAGG